ncbi:MAG TPA: DUF2877 domain-containing protein [Bacteroidales bacterium]|nr:DUF2877 domain-containing protein [Bacteroidales bacterium]
MTAYGNSCSPGSEKNIKITATGDCLKSGLYELFAGFRQIDNFTNAAGEIVSISRDENFLAANAIILNKFSSGHFRKLEIHPDTIIFDNTICSRSNAQCYRSDFTFPVLSYSQTHENLLGFTGRYKHLFPAGSLLYPAKSPVQDSAVQKALFNEFEKALSLFRDHYFDGIRAFRGRGLGLTPSGDDFIAGVLYGTHCLEAIKREDFSGIRNKTFEIAKGKNLFSNNMLQMALEARYFKRLKDFLLALFYPGTTNPEQAFRQLIATGHTSGADLLAGFFAVVLANVGEQNPITFTKIWYFCKNLRNEKYINIIRELF